MRQGWARSAPPSRSPPSSQRSSCRPFFASALPCLFHLERENSLTSRASGVTEGTLTNRVLEARRGAAGRDVGVVTKIPPCRRGRGRSLGYAFRCFSSATGRVRERVQDGVTVVVPLDDDERGVVPVPERVELVGEDADGKLSMERGDVLAGRAVEDARGAGVTTVALAGIGDDDVDAPGLWVLPRSKLASLLCRERIGRLGLESNQRIAVKKNMRPALSQHELFVDRVLLVDEGSALCPRPSSGTTRGCSGVAP